MSCVTTTRLLVTFSKSFHGLPIGSFLLSQAPLYLCQDPSKMSGFMASCRAILNFQWFPVILVSLEISMLSLFPKLEPPWLLRWFVVPLPAIAKTRYTQCHKWRVAFPHSPFISTVPSVAYTGFSKGGGGGQERSQEFGKGGETQSKTILILN